VAAATFTLGMNASLLRVKTDLDRNVASPVRVELLSPDVGGKGGGPVRVAPGGAGGETGPTVADPSNVTTAIAADADTAHSVAIGQTDVHVAGMPDLPLVGYDGESRWLGYALIDGRWFSGPGEAVAPTNFFTVSGLHIGDPVTLTAGGRSITVKLVGEILDTPRESDVSLVLRGDWTDLASLAPAIRPDRWEIQPRSGVDVRVYHSALQEAIGPGAYVSVQSDSTSDVSFLLFLSVVALMGVVLVAMSIGGVFNTVLLETRQRAREVAVLKTIGLTPAQVVTTVIATIVPVGLVAGAIGVPIGLIAQHVVLDYMGQVAARTRVPGEVYDVFPLGLLLGLGLLGLVIGALGAFLPAHRAARARIAPILQAE
jgi:putative ABC transport system permease protein